MEGLTKDQKEILIKTHEIYHYKSDVINYVENTCIMRLGVIE